MATPKTSLRANQLVALDDVRNKFARLWLIGAGIVIFVLVLQSLLHMYRDNNVDLTTDAWGWCLPTLLPSVGLIVTVLTYTALDPSTTGSVVRKSFVPIAFWLSFGYLVLVLLTIVVQPIAGKTPEEAIALMKMSNLWLGPVQGLVSSALGALFFSKEKNPHS